MTNEYSVGICMRKELPGISGSMSATCMRSTCTKTKLGTIKKKKRKNQREKKQQQQLTVKMTISEFACVVLYDVFY